jgi:hypothetical protein
VLACRCFAQEHPEAELLIEAGAHYLRPPIM